MEDGSQEGFQPGIKDHPSRFWCSSRISKLLSGNNVWILMELNGLKYYVLFKSNIVF